MHKCPSKLSLSTVRAVELPELLKRSSRYLVTSMGWDRGRAGKQSRAKYWSYHVFFFSFSVHLSSSIPRCSGWDSTAPEK